MTENNILAGTNHEKRANMKRRSAILSKYLSAQVLVQLLSLFSGLLLVRTLSTQQYAFFTIAGIMQGTIGVLSESGVGSALMSIGGRVWQDKFRFGQLIQTSLSYRKRLMFLASIVITPVLCWTLINNGSSLLNGLLLCLIVILSANFQITNGVLDFTLKMNTRLDLLQKTECLGAVLRTFFIVLICFTFQSALLAVLATLGSLVLQNHMFRRYSRQFVDFAAPVNAEDKIEITKSVKQVSPTTIFYCFQGQITILLISLFGKVSNVAEIGALGRIGVMFLIVNTMVSNVFLPRFTRCQESQALNKMYWQIIAVFGVFSLALISLTTVWPHAFLWMLGKEYEHLARELPFAVASTIVASVGAVIYGLNFSRAWMRFAWVSVPLTLSTQLLMLPFLNLSSIRDVLLLSIIPSVVGWTPYLYEARRMLGRQLDATLT